MKTGLLTTRTVTSTGNGTVTGLGNVQDSQITLLFSATAVSGTTPSLTLSVEWSPDGGVTWFPAETPDAFTAITAVGNRCKTFTVKSPQFRLAWLVSGTTPSFTFTVTAAYQRGASD